MHVSELCNTSDVETLHVVYTLYTGRMAVGWLRVIFVIVVDYIKDISEIVKFV